MSIAQIKAAFVNALGEYGTCTLCTMQYVGEHRDQLLRFYVVGLGGGEEVFTTLAPSGSSLIEAAREKALEIVAMVDEAKGKKPKKVKDKTKDAT